MSDDTVVRRFEVHADTAALDDVHYALWKTAGALPPEHLKAEITRHRRSPMVTARLTGVASAVAKVRESIAGERGVNVLHDWLEVRAPALRDDAYPDLRALLRIDPERRSLNEKGSGKPILVAIVDSGIADGHPDLVGHVRPGTRCMDGRRDDDVTDQDGHGTLLAGTILATANRVHGLQLLPVKFYDVVTQPMAANAAAAIRFAREKKADIINLSFDLGIGSNPLESAIQDACADGALLVIAAGNTGSNNDEYPVPPACYAQRCRDSVITVMATDWYDERPTFSNFGEESVDLAAPGVGIVSTRPSVSRDPDAKRYGRYTGTSAAAAHVTGAAALLKSQNPKRTAPEIKKRLTESGDMLPRLKCVSRRRLNLGRAL